MELIATLFLGALGILAAVAARLLADKFRAWTPWITRSLIQRAIRALPQNLRERYEEEWQSHVGETAGDIGKLLVAFGYLSASRKMGGASYESAKRAWGIATSAFIISQFLPIIFIVAICVKLDSSGPVMVRRPTKIGNRTINTLKFRTFDPRSGKFSPIGKFIRRSSLDELPQIWNVLIGEMSLVGPSLEFMQSPEFTRMLEGESLPGLRNVKPGITGLAQVHRMFKFGPQNDFEKDHYYLKNRSFRIDMKILCLTVKAILVRKD